MVNQIPDENKRLIVCPKCGYSWLSKRGKRIYVTCSSCHYNIRLTPLTPPQDPKTENPLAEEKQ